MIQQEKIKDAETVNWEYLKDRTFNENNILQKGYDTPVVIQLNDDYSVKDSLIVADVLHKIKVLIPSVKVGFQTNREGNSLAHLVFLGFGKVDNNNEKNIIGKESYIKKESDVGAKIYKLKPNIISISNL